MGLWEAPSYTYFTGEVVFKVGSRWFWFIDFEKVNKGHVTWDTGYMLSGEWGMRTWSWSHLSARMEGCGSKWPLLEIGSYKRNFKTLFTRNVSNCKVCTNSLLYWTLRIIIFTDAWSSAHLNMETFMNQLFQKAVRSFKVDGFWRGSRRMRMTSFGQTVP